MNTNNLKKVAPRARTAFIKAITARAAEFGLTVKGISTPSVSGDVLQVAGYTHPSRFGAPLKRLSQRIAEESFTAVIEQMAYTWFNRFCAIRFMELKSEEGYLEHGVRILSHPSLMQGFEVLDRATEVIDSLLEEGVALDKPALLDIMLAGNQQEALFRELLLGQCHRLHGAMPFLFEAIDDETELLLPQGLTRTDAFWRELIDAIPEADWQQVEVIGWLYQFYISEKKDEVIGKVVKSEDIPAATQLFTPNWIVQYLVQNSLGRYWLQTYPSSPLAGDMPYYVAPGEQPAEVLTELARLTPTSIEPESITVLDPACGSGHILVEAYNILYRIYEERGYRSREIPALILSHNLYGLDIDDRAAQLAGFALLMRARQDDRRLFSRNKEGRELSLNIHSLQESHQLNIPKLWQALNLNADSDRGQVQDFFAPAPTTLVTNDVRLNLLQDLQQRFSDAKTLGSLIEVPADKAPAIAELLTALKGLSERGDAMQKPAAKALLPLLQQASVLAKRYDSVIANPPYMGSKGMNAELKEFAKKQFPDSKSDLFAMFMESGFDLLKPNAFHAMVTMQSWMFLSSYENLRIKLLNHSTIECMAHMANMVMGIAFGTAATVCRKGGHRLTRGGFCYVEYENIDDNGRPKQFPPLNDRNLKAVKQSSAASEQGE
ncbi:BREX-1 system adenine-specific DNA-methyltransferase PglX [Shewanella glacialipiscicola]|uniref:BREX-1 system adenine-specific DNA-methyltransferase PglX n=1 Tax=Shewanella glacialipiscicola TaxID=614069 RepID=UPI003D7997F0